MKRKIAIFDAVPKSFWEVDNNVTDGQKIIALLEPYSDHLSFTIYYVAENEFPDSISIFDGIVISGSPCSANDNFGWIDKLSQFITQAYSEDIKLMGICFGHQLIAKVLGGTVSKSNNGWCLGLQELNVMKHANWMIPEIQPLSLYHINKEEVSRLPVGARQIVYSNHGVNYGYAINNSVFCIQGHPEQEYHSMVNFLSHLHQHGLPHDCYEYAMNSMQYKNPDKDVFAAWMVNFLKN